MNSPLCLGHWNSLDPVHTTLVPESAKDMFSGDLENHFFETAQLRRAAFQLLKLESMRFSVPRIHPVEVCSEQSRLATPCPTSNFHDGIPVFVRLRRQQGHLDLFGSVFDLHFQRWDLCRSQLG